MIHLINLAVFSAAAIFCWIISPYFIRLAHRFNCLDYPHDRKAHAKPTPYLGGVGIFLTVWILYLPFWAFLYLSKSEVPIYGAYSQATFMQIPGVFAGGVIVFVLGLLDDRFNLPPLLKFVIQGAAAVILMFFGAQVNLLLSLGFWGQLATFIWIMTIINAFNFIDSIDGHCTGVTLISCLVLFCIAGIVFQPLLATFVAILGGALLGFMPYNWKPARTFLGDNGSLFLGYMMAALTLLFSYRSANSQYSVITPFIPIFMFGVPIYDTLSVIVVRTFRGIPAWKGDRNHFAHRLVRLGMNEKIACLVSFFIVFTLGLVAILSTQVNTTIGKIVITILFVSVIGIIALLEYYAAGRIRIMEELAAQNKRRADDVRAAEDKKFF